MDELKQLEAAFNDVNEQKVYEMAYHKIPVEQIAKYFDVSRSTMYSKYGLIIQRAHMERQLDLRKAQIATAMSGNATMQIWLGKQDLDQRDQPHSDSDDEITEVSFTVKRVPKVNHEDDAE